MLERLIRGFTGLGISALLLVGCAAPVSKPARLGLKLSPAVLGASISLQQHLSLEWDGQIGELDAGLEVNPERLDLVGLAFGQRVLALHYDGQTLQSWRHPLLAVPLRGEDVLEDLQLTFWPIEAIRQVLPDNWRIEETALRRTLLQDDTPVTVIDYSGWPRWIGKIELANRRYQYRLTIQSVSSGS